jgi:hypothetical protein
MAGLLPGTGPAGTVKGSEKRTRKLMTLMTFVFMAFSHYFRLNVLV